MSEKLEQTTTTTTWATDFDESHSVEITEILFLTKKIFRQINSLVTSYVVKPLLSQTVCQKCVRDNSCNFQTVWSTVWKLRKFTLTLFWQKFHESDIFTKEITK